jgi:LemA protein
MEEFMIYVNERVFTMTFFSCVATVVAVLLVVILYHFYVELIKKRNKVKEAMGGIDVQLKKRYSLIPNILTIANKFMEHERGLFEEITNLRTKASEIQSTKESIAEKIKLDNEIASKMGQLLVNVENYPQLKSDATMVQAMQTYAEVEEHISAARRFYNSAVNDLNNAVEIFPSSIVAKFIGITAYPFFEANEEEKQDVNAADYFNK